MGRLFGTDGVRGIANNDITCELAMNIGRAVGLILSSNPKRCPIILVGSDTRLSSSMLSCSVASGLCSVGADVIQLGVIPTPAVAYLVGKYKANAGIMISASHNPAKYNGIKIFNEDGYKFPDELEERVEAMVLGEIPMPLCESEKIGSITFSDNAVRDYVDHLRSTVLYSLDGMKIAVDCANGSASRTAERLFSSLGADYRILSASPDGLNINRKCGSTDLAALSEYVAKNGMDAGVAFDGDADRCLCVDETGAVIDGDSIMAIVAYDMKSRGRLLNNAVVGTIMTNFGLSKFCEENGIKYVATKVGDRFVLEEMLLEDYWFGGEQSGHIIFRDFSTTGDGELTAIQLLSLVKRCSKKLSEMAKIMKHYPQITENITVSKEGKLAFYTDEDVKEAIETGKKKISGTGRLVVRVSGTEPYIRVMAEGDDMKLVNEVVKETVKVITKKLSIIK